MGGLSIAEKNRRKRERKKKEKQEEQEERKRKEELEYNNKEQQEQQHDGSSSAVNNTNDSTSNENEDDFEIEIEYVAEDPLLLFNSGGKDTTKNNKKNSSTLPDGLPPGLGQDGSSTNNGDEQPPGEEDNDEQPPNNNHNQENNIEDVLRRFQERAGIVDMVSSAVVSDDGKDENDDDGGGSDNSKGNDNSDDDDDDDDSDNGEAAISKRKLREILRPSVAELKRRVERPDLVEAHDVTAFDPDFLILLKGIPGTTPVPRHWGRKRKYLQGKRGFEKPPFQLPDFITKTGIAEIRDTVADDEGKQSAKQKNRSRVNPKMGSMDVDYKVLHEAFFKYQTKPKGLTTFGDLYYEGKELETSTDIIPGGPYSTTLRDALGMVHPTNSPPPWLLNVQRFGPPPSYPQLRMPGLNAPLPTDQCQYGYHPGGWGKPPVDAYGRPLYGGNPFDPPGSSQREYDDGTKELVTSDGKTIMKTTTWGGLPFSDVYSSGGIGGDGKEDDDDSESEDDDDDDDELGSGDDDMEESVDGDGGGNDEEDHGDDTLKIGGMESVLPPPPMSSVMGDLRKQTTAGDETPIYAPPPKQLYQVLETKTVGGTSTLMEEDGAGQGSGGGGVFQSEVQYVVPGITTATPVPEGAESVLSKAMVPGGATTNKNKKRKVGDGGDEDDDAFDKNFKF